MIGQNSACADGVIQHQERAAGDVLHPASDIDHFIDVIELADHALDAELRFDRAGVRLRAGRHDGFGNMTGRCIESANKKFGQNGHESN